MNVLPAEQVEHIQRLLTGMSIRAIERHTGVHRDTVMRIKHERTTVKQREDGKCYATSQPKRLAAYGDPIPEGMRLGWTCAVPYCDNPEHFTLTQDLSYGRRDYSEIRKSLWALDEEGYFDLPDEPSDENSVLKFRTALAVRSPHFITRTLPTGGVRIIRTGDYYEPKKQILARHRVLLNRMSVWLRCDECHEVFLVGAAVHETRRYCSLECSGKGRTTITNQNSIGSVFLGMFWGTWDDGSPRIARCKARACPFPQNGNGEGLCRHHYHFFDVDKIDRNTGEVKHEDWTELAKYQLDRRDLYPNEDNPHPLYHTGMLWEDQYNWQRVRVLREGDTTRANKAERLSDAWWKENVERLLHPEGEAPKAGSCGQASGHLRHRIGGGRGKIRKTQRKRAQQVGWHGSRPDQKPHERFTREQLDRLPIFSSVRKVPKAAPLTEEEPNEYEDELMEREELAASIGDITFDDEPMDVPDSFSWEAA